MAENNQDLEQEIIDNETVENDVVEETVENDIEDAVVETEESKVAELEETVKQLNDKVLRQMAEFDNFRKRTQKEKQTSFADGTKNVVEKLLPVLDNFERAMVSEEDKEANFYKGVEMIYKQFNGMLNELGIKPIESVGQEFDPNLHFAVATEENEEFGENTVSEELQKGYMHHDRVLRAAMVKVANN